MSALMATTSEESMVSITPLLKRLWEKREVTANEVAAAISHIFTNSLSPVQSGALLTALHFHDWDSRPDVLMKCSEAMRNAARQFDRPKLNTLIKSRQLRQGAYRGGLVRYHLFILKNCAKFVDSATLSVQEETRTTRSTSALRPRS